MEQQDGKAAGGAGTKHPPPEDPISTRAQVSNDQPASKKHKSDHSGNVGPVDSMDEGKVVQATLDAAIKENSSGEIEMEIEGKHTSKEHEGDESGDVDPLNTTNRDNSAQAGPDAAIKATHSEETEMESEDTSKKHKGEESGNAGPVDTVNEGKTVQASLDATIEEEPFEEFEMTAEDQPKENTSQTEDQPENVLAPRVPSFDEVIMADPENSNVGESVPRHTASDVQKMLQQSELSKFRSVHSPSDDGEDGDDESASLIDPETILRRNQERVGRRAARSLKEKARRQLEEKARIQLEEKTRRQLEKINLSRRQMALGFDFPEAPVEQKERARRRESNDILRQKDLINFGFNPVHEEPAGSVYQYENEEDPTVGSIPYYEYKSRYTPENFESDRFNGRDHHWGPRVSAFLRSDPCWNKKARHFVGVGPLGFGRRGLVGLWQQRSSIGEVTRSVAIKETFPHVYEGDSEPTESRILRKLAAVHCDTIIDYVDYRRFPNQKKTRVYFEYAPFFNLEILINRYRRWRRYFHEPWLWYLFNCLAKALVVLESGQLPDEACDTGLVAKHDEHYEMSKLYRQLTNAELSQVVENRGLRYELEAICKKDGRPIASRHDALTVLEKNDEDAFASEHSRSQTSFQTHESFEPRSLSAKWMEVVHRNINAQSILLGNCSEEYPWWPTPKLTNFDNAIETDEDDLLNPFLYNGKVSNHGHSLGPMRTSLDPQARVSAHTNVYQVGNLMRRAAMMDAQKLMDDQGTVHKDRLPPYSAYFLVLVGDCSSPDPRRRPSPRKLYRITKKYSEKCRQVVLDDPERFKLWYREYDINKMPTGFAPSFEKKQIGPIWFCDGLTSDVPFQFPNGTIEPPPMTAFYPYESDNHDLFKQPRPGFRQPASNTRLPFNDTHTRWDIYKLVELLKEHGEDPKTLDWSEFDDEQRVTEYCKGIKKESKSDDEVWNSLDHFPSDSDHGPKHDPKGPQTRDYDWDSDAPSEEINKICMDWECVDHYRLGVWLSD